ncbi:MAG: Iron-sulfur cluster carrier protein [Chlamydiia bacterium]|nr:Iron-sulfur cluster carrier protein [Chlamydiia bacterium]MCH9616137.1 Iron-sulfur cluster carrier protein [Chlamydiia bacterium]MCH9629440.1 Iron-sulfur cluster carrier protein [Chlamydiia bacterium]
MKTIGIVSGKGGVGKSTTAVNLAQALARFGRKVGILDADIYGPSLQKILPEDSPPGRNGDFVTPAKSGDLSLMSAAYFKNQEALFVRAPIANQLITQMLNEVLWGEIDDLIIDFPPGTGDVGLTLMQKSNLYGAIIITTPHELSFIDAEKSMQMTRDMGVPLLGVIENMSHFQGNPIFGEGAGEALAEKFHVPLLGQLPISPNIDRECDQIAQKILEEEHQILPNFELQDGGLKIEWPDGMTSFFQGATIQKFCPCAQCENKRLAPKSAVKLLQIEPVGRYAVRVQFSSGCSKGIFPFSLFRQLTREYA